jgi:hypothetical protein
VYGFAGVDIDFEPEENATDADAGKGTDDVIIGGRSHV